MELLVSSHAINYKTWSYEAYITFIIRITFTACSLVFVININKNFNLHIKKNFFPFHLLKYKARKIHVPDWILTILINSGLERFQVAEWHSRTNAFRLNLGQWMVWMISYIYKRKPRNWKIIIVCKKHLLDTSLNLYHVLKYMYTKIYLKYHRT